MEPFDKFGNQIYPKTYNKMLGYSRILIKNGYSESVKKPNLFFRKDEDAGVIFFADMRGTDIVAIWEDPSPMLYVRFPNDMPRWNQKRLLEEEYRALRICRLSFYEECEPGGLMFGEGGDGYCIVCGKDFQDEGLFCSKQCEEAYGDLGKTRCQVCGKELAWDQALEHHLSYEEDKTITVCRSCHLKIHRGSKLPRLKPQDMQERGHHEKGNLSKRVAKGEVQKGALITKGSGG